MEAALDLDALGVAIDTPAPDQRALRTMASPALVMEPVTSMLPDWYFRGVRPRCAPNRFDEVKRCGIVDTSLEGQCRQGAHAWHGHQMPADMIGAGNRPPTGRIGLCHVVRPEPRLRT